MIACKMAKFFMFFIDKDGNTWKKYGLPSTSSRRVMNNEKLVVNPPKEVGVDTKQAGEESHQNWTPIKMEYRGPL